MLLFRGGWLIGTNDLKLGVGIWMLLLTTFRLMNWQAIGEINLQGSFVIFRVSIRSNWSLNFYFEQEAEILKDLCDIFSYFSIFVR